MMMKKRKKKEVIRKNSSLPSDYLEVLDDIKKWVYTSRLRASISVNRELILLYWEIGRMILQRQKIEGWGAKVIDRLSADLKKEFPDMKGLSSRNLKYMRSFAEAYPTKAFVQELLAQITWYHNITLLEKINNRNQRECVEYTLRDTKKPMGVATYRILPSKLKGELPTARQIEKGIGKA